MKKIVYLSLLVFVFSSCSGFLEEIPKGETTTANFYTTEAQAVSATNGIYGYVTMGYAPGGLFDNRFGGVFYNYYWVLQDLFADNSETQQTGVDFTSTSSMQIDPYNSPVKYLWRNFYQTIKACNMVLDKVPAVNMDLTEKKNLLAEARFFRAMMYFDLVRMFGDVPLHTSNVDNIADGNIPRTPKADIYKLIISDLITAEADLQYTPRQLGGAPTSLSATALLARVYNTYGAQYKDLAAFQKAIDCANKVIPAYPMQTNFADIFKLTNRFNSEIIWGADYNSTLSGGFYGSQFLVRLLPPVLTATFGQPTNAQGWETGTNNLLSSYSSGDVRKGVTLQTNYTSGGTTVNLPHPYFFKYWDQAIEPKGNNSDAIFPAIRTAEMYLIIAEASNEVHNGATAEAINALQAVRNRAGVGAQTIPSDYAGFKSAVLNEYRLEFAMEGHRWFDLTRMCTPSQFSAYILAAKPTATPHDYNFLFPIPQQEINLSHGVLTQNPGYSTK